MENLEKCGVSCYDLERKIHSLAWFVGGDPRKITELQRKLNDLGLFQHLKEDGVYGKKTHEAVCKLHAKLENPDAPKLYRVGTVLDIASSSYKALDIANDSLNDAAKNIKNFSVVSGGHSPGSIIRLQATGNYRYLDGMFVSGDSSQVLRRLGDASVFFERNGRLFSAAGVVFDTLYLSSALYKDLTDADKKLGADTVEAITKITVSNLASPALASAGATVTPLLLAKLGGAAGTLIAPGVGTVVGAIIGSALFVLVGNYAIDTAIDGIFELIE